MAGIIKTKFLKSSFEARFNRVIFQYVVIIVAIICYWQSVFNTLGRSLKNSNINTAFQFLY